MTQLNTDKPILPVWFRIGIVAALSLTLYASYAYRINDSDKAITFANTNHGKKIQTTQLHFIDLPDGAVSVIDASTNQEITLIKTGEDGFLRSVMRGLVRERKAKGIGPEVPFELAVWQDGLVSLLDPTTLRRVELSAFGRDNVAAFTRLLPEHSTNHQPG